MAQGSNASKSAEVKPAAADDVNAVPEGQPAPQPASAAKVAQARYSEGEGWELGQRAPADRWRKLDATGQPTGKALSSPPKGEYATQVAVKGAVVNNITRSELGLND